MYIAYINICLFYIFYYVILHYIIYNNTYPHLYLPNCIPGYAPAAGHFVI